MAACQCIYLAALAHDQSLLVALDFQSTGNTLVAGYKRRQYNQYTNKTIQYLRELREISNDRVQDATEFIDQCQTHCFDWYASHAGRRSKQHNTQSLPRLH